MRNAAGFSSRETLIGAGFSSRETLMGALVVGEALIDVMVRDGRTLGERVGGSPLNVAVGLARLGRSVEFLTLIGDDPRGRRITKYLRSSGVTLADGSVCAGRTATAFATLDRSGSATYVFDIEWRPSRRRPPGDPVLMHTGSIAAVLKPGRSDVSAMIDAYSPTATITYDPNVRPALIDDPDDTRAQIESVVSRADVVKASHEDLAWVAPAEPPERVAANWLALGPAIVAVTFGARGAYGICADGDVRIPAHPAEVVDTVGAGDAFTAGLIDALWDLAMVGGHRRQQLREISRDVLREVLQTAALSSALTVARPGAELPDRAARDGARGGVPGQQSPA